MTVTLVSGSSILLVTGTETTLTNVGEPGRFQLVADLTNIAAGDGIEFRVKAMATPTGTARVVEYMAYFGAQPTDDMVKLSTPVPNDQTDGNALIFTATQILGTGRSLLWKVLNLEDTPPNFMSLGISSLGHISNVDLVGQVTGSAMSLVSGASVSFDPSTVWSFTGSRSLNGLQTWNVSGTITNVFNVLNDVHVSGTVLASAVQGGFVTVSGAVIADVRSLVGVSGTVLASAVQGGFVTVSGAVVADVRSLVGVSGTVIADVRSLVGISGTVDAIRGGFVTVSGAVVADVRSLVGVSGTVLASAVQGLVGISGTVEAVRGGFVTVSGSVVAGTVLDKTGYSLSSPQVFNLIGNVSGTITNVYNVISGTPATINASDVWQYTGAKVVDAVAGGYVTASGSISVDPASVWAFTGSRSLNGPQYWNLSGSIAGNILGYVGQVTGSVMSLVSGATASFDPAQVWLFTGTRSLNGIQQWNLDGYVGQVTGSVMSVISGSTPTIDYSQVWNYTGSKIVDAVRGGYVSVSGTVVVSSGVVNTVYNVVSGTPASIDYGQIWAFTGSRSLNGTQTWDLNGNFSGTIQPPISAVATGVSIDYASIWGYSVRTLTSQVFNLPPVEQDNNLNIIRGDTFIWAPTNLGSLANLSKLYFTIKRLYTDLDSESEVQIEKTAGLIYINRGPASTPLNGSIVVNDVNLGNITITLAASETAKLDLLRDVYYDVQFINASGTVTTLVGGLVTIAGDATRGTTP